MNYDFIRTCLETLNKHEDGTYTLEEHSNQDMIAVRLHYAKPKPQLPEAEQPEEEPAQTDTLGDVFYEQVYYWKTGDDPTAAKQLLYNEVTATLTAFGIKDARKRSLQ